MTDKFFKLGIIGSGAWGTALATHAARQHINTVVYCRDPQNIELVNTEGLPPEITVEHDLSALTTCDLLLMVLPTQAISRFLEENKHHHLQQPVLLCSKGIDNQNLSFISDIIVQLWQVPVAVLAGPNLANEIKDGEIAAVTIASKHQSLLIKLSNTLASEKLAVQISQDVYGVQLLGAFKNAIAIACGIIMGMGLGENYRASIITAALREAMLLLSCYDADPKTCYTYAGIGDLVLTCSSTSSRNTKFGYLMGSHHISAASVLAQHLRGQTVEGYHSCAAIAQLAKHKHLHLPIIAKVYDILYRDQPVCTLADIKVLLNN